MTIKQLRALTGLSQRDFSDYFGISKRSIQEWEQGRKKPSEYWITLMLRLWVREQHKQLDTQAQNMLINNLLEQAEHVEDPTKE